MGEQRDRKVLPCPCEERVTKIKNESDREGEKKREQHIHVMKSSM